MTLQEWAALDEDVEGELVDGMLEGEELSTFLHARRDVDSRRPSYLGTPPPRLRRGFRDEARRRPAARSQARSRAVPAGCVAGAFR